MGVGRELLADGVAGLFDVEVRAAEEAVGLTEEADIGGGKAMTLQADLVDAAEFGGVAVCDHEGDDVLNDLGATAKDGVAPDAAELVDAGEAAYDGVVLDDNVSGEGAIV